MSHRIYPPMFTQVILNGALGPANAMAQYMAKREAKHRLAIAAIKLNEEMERDFAVADKEQAEVLRAERSQALLDQAIARMEEGQSTTNMNTRSWVGTLL